ncbi:MAG: hypothetical protein KDB27_12330 [Planctomycetales bacterium]|nr:hypothetical protein [Planctomycetales bacterium]
MIIGSTPATGQEWPSSSLDYVDPQSKGASQTLALMLHDARILLEEREFRIARELVDAVLAEPIDLQIRSSAIALREQIDRFDNVTSSPQTSQQAKQTAPKGYPIPEMAVDSHPIIQVANDVVDEDTPFDFADAERVSRRTPVVRTLSSEFDGENCEMRIDVVDSNYSSELPEEKETVALLDNLVSNLGLDSASLDRTARTEQHQPTIVINPPGPAVLAPNNRSQSRAANEYTAQELTYLSALCFAIGLLTCPAALLIGFAFLRRTSGGRGPLIHVSIASEEFTTPSEQKVDSHSHSGRLSPSNHGDEELDSLPCSEDLPESPNVMPLHGSSVTPNNKTSEANVYRQIVNHNLSIKHSDEASPASA